MTELKVPVSVGELIDKITILEIKAERISDPAKLDNVRAELALLTEIWGLLGLAALVGLVAGWIIWGGRAGAADNPVITDLLRADLDACRKLHAEKDARIAKLEAAKPAVPVAEPAVETPVPVAAPVLASRPEAITADVKPATLDAPRDGIADDLKKIKGIGPKLEKMCNTLGFWHYEQIAAWTDEEAAWVDANLEGFKGRVTRDG